MQTYRILALNQATVDVPGVIMSLLWRPRKHVLHLFGYNIIVYIGLPKVYKPNAELPSSLERFVAMQTALCNGTIIHTGVGSNVVCLTKLAMQEP